MIRNLLNNCVSRQITSQLLVASNFNCQQLRTTFILKRRTPVPLYKKNQRHSKLRGRHFNYELIVDTNVVKKPNIEVILTSYVEGIGRKGDVVSVTPTFGYDKLLLPGLATYVTPAAVEKYTQPANAEDEEKHSSQFAQRTVNMLQSKPFAIVMNKDHPWELQPWHIRASLRKAGFHILNDSAIELPKEKITGPDLAKQNKEFIVTVTINNTEQAKVRCRIHHWSTNPTERLPYVFEHFKQPAESLFGGEEVTKA